MSDVTQDLIRVNQVTRVYRDSNGNPVEALRRVSLGIRRGEFISILGPSGCGKTTILRLIAGLDQPQEGHCTIDGAFIDSPSPLRGYIFQQPTLFPWLTVAENAAAGLKARGVYEAQKHRIGEYIDLIGLSGFEDAYPHEISGGMAQRVAIIRALINEPKVLLLDEPLGALDAFKRIELQSLLRDVWRKTGTTMAMVTHDVDEAIAMSCRIVVMSPRPGEIVDILEVSPDIAHDRTSDDFSLLRKKILRTLKLVTEANRPEYSI